MALLTEVQRGIVATVRNFVDKEVIPTASALDHADEYPYQLVEQMKELGLFGALIPEEYGGLGLDIVTYTHIIEELSRGWMSISGIVNSHLILAYLIVVNGTEEQKQQFLPRMSTGEIRGGICITEANAGSDVQGIQTKAVRDGDEYVINGDKSYVSNGRHGHIFALVTKTDPLATPAHRGMTIFIAEKGPGFEVIRDIPKLGYKGMETCQLAFDDYRVPAANILGGEEGKGFYHIMSGLEVGRINVAARAVGVARAALEGAVRFAQQRETFGKPIAQHQAIQLMLADMATQVQAAHLLVINAAERKSRGERADLEAGMAKLFASEACLQVATNAMRIHGGVGYTKDLPFERYFRDAPLMIIGEGTNEIQKMVISRALLSNFPSGDFIYQSGL